MGSQKKRAHEEEKSCEPLDTGRMPEQTSSEAQVNYGSAPARQSPAKKIHPRQPMPPLPEGDEVPDNKPSPPVELDE